MARSYGRLFTSLWDDQDFRPLSLGAKLMYGFLISQDDLEHSGIIGWRPARWARDLGEPVEDVIAYLKELDQARYVIIDEEAVESLVRSLIRRDDIWRQPNVFKAAAASAKTSKSPPIKAALYPEIRRLDLVGTGRETHAIRDELLSHLEPFANPSPNPPEGFPKGSRGPSEGSEKGSRNANGRVGDAASVDNPAGPDVSAGQNPSGTVREPVANHSARPTDKGNGYGPVLEVAIPHSLTPSPPAAPEPSCPPRLFALPDVNSEGDQPEEQTPEQLAAAVRRLRPGWSTKSIERALADPSVAERPWPMVCDAMLAVARDPESKHPGRLAHDGPWWARAASSRRASLPPVERHAYEPDRAGDACRSCRLPKSNRRHLEASLWMRRSGELSRRAGGAASPKAPTSTRPAPTRATSSCSPRSAAPALSSSPPTLR